jgi:hypothetical protein
LLGPRHLLLLLDKRERLVDACAALASATVFHCPAIGLEGTSQVVAIVSLSFAFRYAQCTQ